MSVLVRRISQLPTATAILDGHCYLVTDGATAGDASTGGGTYLNLVTCDGSGPTWKAIASIGSVFEASALTNNTIPVADANGELEDSSVTDNGSTVTVTGDIAVTGTVDGRDVATDGTKLDGIETAADVTDATNVRAAGAVMEASGNLSNNVVPVSDGSGDLEDGSIYDDGTKVGIGTTSPISILDVVSSGPSFYLHDTDTGETATDGFNLTLLNTELYFNLRESGTAHFFVAGAERMSIDSTAVDIHDALGLQVQGSDPSTVANTAHVYSKDVSASAEVFVQDEAGNATQISPHDPETGEWIFYSENVKTGRKVRIDMERMVRKIEEHLGESFITEEQPE